MHGQDKLFLTEIVKKTVNPMWDEHFSVCTTLFRNERFMLDEMLQNLLFFIYLYENPKLLFPFFISCYFIFLPNECPGLYRHRPGHSLGENIKLHEMENEKKHMGFLITKIWQILQRFSWEFS